MSDISLKGVAGVIMLLAGVAISLAALIVAVLIALFGAHRHPRGFRGVFARVGAGPLAALVVAALAVAWAFVASNEMLDDASPVWLAAMVVVGVVAAIVVRRRATVGSPRDQIYRDRL